MSSLRTQMAHQKERQAASLPALFKHLLGCAEEKERPAFLFPVRLSLDAGRSQKAAAVPLGKMSERILGYAAQLALLACGAFAQSPTPVYNDFSPLIKGVTVGPDHCYFWLRSPGQNDVHTACYFSGALVYNAISTLGTAAGSQGKDEAVLDWNGTTVKWCFTLGTFTLSVTLPDGTTPLVKSGTF